MHALIVYAHPEPTSFNGALKDLAAATLQRRGYHVEVSDLYAEGFDPREGPWHYPDRADTTRFSALTEQRHASDTATLPDEIRRELHRLERADLLLLQFPLWWHGPPAMLKGWLDRVFVYGGRYTSRMRYDTGYYRGRHALLSLTTGAPATAFGPGSRGGDLDVLLHPLHYSLHYMGYTVLPPFVAHGIQSGGVTYETADRFHALLEEHKHAWTRRLEHLDGDRPLSFPGWDDWDETGAARTPASDDPNHGTPARPLRERSAAS